MALNLTKCRMTKVQEFNIVPGFSIKEEGIPLVREFVDGKEHVKVFDGTNLDVSKFIGFSYTESLTPLTATNGVQVILDADGKVVLTHKVVVDQISVYDVSVNLGTGVTSQGTRYANGDVTVDADGMTITVTGGANKTVDIVYLYEPTVQDLVQTSQLRLLIPTMSSSEMTGSIGAIIDGEVYTDRVDLSADFTAANINFGINDTGMLTCFTGDTPPANVLAISNMELIEYPTSENPSVGVRITR